MQVRNTGALLRRIETPSKSLSNGGEGASYAARRVAELSVAGQSIDPLCAPSPLVEVGQRAASSLSRVLVKKSFASCRS